MSAPAERAAVAMTVLCAGGPLGTAAGQAVSGTLADAHGVDGALLVALVVAAGALLLALSAFLADRQRNIWIIDAAPPRRPVLQKLAEHPRNPIERCAGAGGGPAGAAA